MKTESQKNNLGIRETISAAIGQGYVTVTPLQMAVYRNPRQ